MTLEELGNLGEFVAAISVVLSLLYLGYQVRQHTIELGLQSFREVFEGFSNTRQRILESPDLLKIHLKALDTSEGLTEEEKIKLGYLLEDYLFSMQQYHMHLSSGRFANVATDSPGWKAAKRRVFQFLRSTSGRSWWAEWKDLYRPEFRVEIESLLENEK